MDDTTTYSGLTEYNKPNEAVRKKLALRLSERDDGGGNVQEIARMRTQLSAVGIDIDDLLYNLTLLRSIWSRFKNLTAN